MSLIPCAACQRHVFTTETICPFCQQELATLDVAGGRRASSARMSRAALVLLGMSSVACGSDTGTSGGVAIPVYGSPPTAGGGASSNGTGGVGGQAQGGAAGEPSDSGGAAGESSDSGVGGTVSLPGTGGGAAPVDGAPPAPER